MPITRPLPQYAQAPLLPLIIAFLALQALSTDLYLASLPGLATVFDVPASTVQLTLSMFVIGFGGAQLVAGPLSDRFGRKPVLAWGIGLYIVASLLCAAAPDINLLIAARFLQSLGCCAAVIVARAIVTDAWPPEAAPHVIAKASTFMSVVPLLGPIAGSYLQVTFGWRAAFVAMSAVSALLLLVVLLRLPETNQHKNPHATDLKGLVAGYRLVLGSREFWAYGIPGALSYGSIFAFISGASLVLIRVLDVPTAMFGYCFAVAVSGYLLGTIVCRRLLARFSTALTLRIGSTASLAAGALFLLTVSLGVMHWAAVVGAMFLTMCAHGINFPVAQSGSVTPFPHNAGTAAGLMGVLAMAVAFVVGSVVGATFDGTMLPLAITACALGALIFASVRVLALRPQEVAA